MRPDDFPDAYEFRLDLGEGSMGAVYLATSLVNQGQCAIKILNTHADRKGTSERSFNREVRAMARLDHASIIKIFDYGRTPAGSPFLAMEYVPGTSLHEYITGPWRWAQLWNVLDNLLSGLAHAHARDMIHRDLKPSNIIIMPDMVGPGSVKILDFGIALALHDAEKATRRIEGTPAYIAPEAASGDVAASGPWTDLYSLGVILFEILTGDLPFHGRNLLSHHQRTPLPDLKIRPDVEAPQGLIPIVLRLLEKSTVKRFHSVAGVRRALQALAPMPEPLPLSAPEFGDLWADDDDITYDRGTISPVVGPTGTGLIHLREPPLAGRAQARAVLRHAADLALAGAGPRLVIIEADAGFGKSRLADWLRENVAEAGEMRTLIARSDPQTTDAGLRQGILRYIGAPTLTREEAPKMLQQAFSDPGLCELAYDALFGEHGEQTQQQTNNAFYQLLQHFALEGPMLFQAEDAHWSPEGRVLRLIQKLINTKGLEHLLVVVTMRPGLRPSVQQMRNSLLELTKTDHIELGPIPPFDLAPSLESLAQLPPGIAEAASISAAGNPLIALESIRAFVESEGLSSAPIDPSTVLQERIEQATRGEHGEILRSILVRSTLLGRSFTTRPLLRLCAVPDVPNPLPLPTTEEELESYIEEAIHAGLCVEQGEGRWRFSHDLVRTQLRQICRSMPNFVALNLAAAKIKAGRARKDHTGIEVEVVARHLWDGEQHEKALRLGLEGAERLCRSGMMSHAASFTRRLIEWNDKDPTFTPEERGLVHLICSEACEQSGQLHEAENLAKTVVDIARGADLPALAARAASRIGLLCLRNDNVSNAERWLWDALRFARVSGDPRARADAHFSLGQYYLRAHQYRSAYQSFESSLESALAGELKPEEMAARKALAILSRQEGRLEQATDTFLNLLQIAQEESLEVEALEIRHELGLCAWRANDPVQAQQYFEEVNKGARGNLYVLEFNAALGLAWSFAAQDQWFEVDVPLIQAEDLRHDVRRHNDEINELRRSFIDLAYEKGYDEYAIRVERLTQTPDSSSFMSNRSSAISEH